MILKRVILCLGIMMVVLACNRFNGPEKPDDLIPVDKMVDILIDAKLITSANSANTKILKNNNLDVNSYVYQKHNIDSLQFVRSNAYYAFHTDTYDAIYEKAIDSLAKIEAELKAIQAEEWKSDTK